MCCSNQYHIYKLQNSTHKVKKLPQAIQSNIQFDPLMLQKKTIILEVLLRCIFSFHSRSKELRLLYNIMSPDYV